MKYQYKVGDLTALELFVGVTMTILFIWVLITMFEWFTSYPPTTLLNVIKDQWEWVKSLRIY